MFHILATLFLLIVATSTDDAIKDLGSNDWRVREQATYMLKCGANKGSMQKLSVVMSKTDDMEVKYRAERILAWYEYKTNPPPEFYPNEYEGCATPKPFFNINLRLLLLLPLVIPKGK